MTAQGAHQAMDTPQEWGRMNGPRAERQQELILLLFKKMGDLAWEKA